MSTKRQVTSMFTVFALTLGLIAAAPVAANANTNYTSTRDGSAVTIEVDCDSAAVGGLFIEVMPGDTVTMRNKPGTTCNRFTVRADFFTNTKVGMITTPLPNVFTRFALPLNNGVQERVFNISPTSPDNRTSNEFYFTNNDTKGIAFNFRIPRIEPRVLSVSPTTLPTRGGTRVTITGTGFVQGATAQFGMSACTNVTVVSPTTLTCTSGIHPLGTNSARVRNPNGRAHVGGSVTFVSIPAAVIPNPQTANTTDFYADLSGATETSMRTVANQGPIPLRGSFSLDFWVFDPSTRDNSRATIIAQSSSDTNNRLEIQVDGPSASFMDQELIVIYRGVEHRTLFKLPQNTWTHITLLSNASTVGLNKIWLRVDNHQVFEVVTDSAVDGNKEIKGPLFIGRAYDDSAKQLFKGRVDQVKVWSSVLNLDSIERSMHTWGAQGAQVGTTLLAHYDFNDRTLAGGLIYNRAANAHHMSLTGLAGTSPFVDVKQTLPTSGKTTLLFPRSYLTQVGGWRAPNGVTAVQEALVVGGGGSGGYDGASGGGGGGAQLGSIPNVTNQTLAIGVGQGGVPGDFSTALQGSNGQTSRLLLGTSEVVNAAGGGRGEGSFGSTTRGTGGSSSSFANFTSFEGGSGGLGGSSTTQEKQGNPGTTTVASRFDQTYSFGGGGGAGIRIGGVQPTEDVTRASGGLGGGGFGASVGNITTAPLIHFCAALTSGKGASAGGNATPNTGGGGGGGTAFGDNCAATPNTRYDGERTVGGHGGSGVVIFGITSAVPFAPTPTFTVVATDNGTDALTANWSDMPNAATTRKVVQYRAGNGSWFQVFDSPSATSFSMPRTVTGIVEFRVTQFDAASRQFGEWVYSNQLEVTLYSGIVLCANPLKLRYDVPASQTVTMNFTNSLAPISIRWGDGTSVPAFTTANTTTPTQQAKTYTTGGTYTIEVCGKFERFVTTGANLVEVVQWGEWVNDADLTDPPARSLASAFVNATRLTGVPATLPSTVTNASSLFQGASAFNDPAIASWTTTNVTNMSAMFASATTFNQNIAAWNVANVTDMSSMFATARDFNQNISSWNVSKVTNMSNMFSNAASFNQNISAWNTIEVTNFSRMLFSASAYTSKPPLKIDKATNAANMLDMSGISDETYSRTILDWAALTAGTTRPAALALGAVDKIALCSVTGTAVSPHARLLVLVAGGWTVTDKTNRVADTCATTITVTATSTTQRYGDPVPSVRFTPVVTGPLAADPTWVNEVTCSAKVSANSDTVTRFTPPANNYVTQCTGPASSGTGINVVYVNGTHTVTTRPIEITIKNRIERQGSTFASATTSRSSTNDRTEYAITSGDLVGTDELSVTISKGTARNATQFDLIGTLAVDGEGSRYSVTFVQGVLTISDKTFIVTAKNQTKMFGDLFNLDNVNGWTCQASNPADDASCKTSLGSVTLSSSGTPETANKGPYAITSSVTESSDRTVVNANGGILTVTKRPITVSPSDLTVNAGSAIPAYPLTISNWHSVLELFQGSEPDGFESPTCTSGYTPNTTRGSTLAITCSGGNPGDNYYFVYESATLTVPDFTDVLFLTPDIVPANPSTGSVVVPFEFNITPFVRICYATLMVTNLSGNFEVVEGQPTNVIERRVLVDSSTLRFNLDLPEGEYEYSLVMDGNCAVQPVSRRMSITPASGSSQSLDSGLSPVSLMPQPQAISPSRASPRTRTIAQIEGRNLSQVVRIRIGGKTIRNVTATETSLNFTIPRLRPGRYDILLVMRDGTTQRWQQQLRITGRSAASAPFREFAGFAAGSSTLTSAMRASITRYLNANKANFRTIECVGYTDGPFIRRTDVPLSMARAKQVCDLARSLGYEVASRSYVNERTPGAQLRKVRLILGK